MEICDQCKEQSTKSYRAKPHDSLRQVDDVRIFKSLKSKGYIEQDYQCNTCNSKFTQSTNKDDLPWVLWEM